jgi:NAD(P)-dependent dehydrogenase (short-subunit alcohol dehydrogenase family)
MTQTVFITGCSSGVGKSAARHFARQGWNVVATMRRPDPELATEFPDRVLVQPLDVADPASIEVALEAGVARFGGIDAVVNNAGITISESLAYELDSQNVRVKLVESGAIRTTNFTASGMALSQAAAVPAEYRDYFDHALKAMIDYPFDSTEEQAVAETVYRAAIDPTNRLRYLVGPDVEEYARLRWSTSEDEYLAGMGRIVGQTAWRERAV